MKPGFHWLSFNRPTGKHSHRWFSSPGLCILGFFSYCACSSTATSTQRRRERKIRAQARLRWFLHRKGHWVLTSAQLEQIHRQLRAHHSRDPKFLKLIQKEMASMRSTSRTRQTKAPPWRCGQCKRLVKGKEEFWPWLSLPLVGDPGYNLCPEQLGSRTIRSHGRIRPGHPDHQERVGNPRADQCLLGIGHRNKWPEMQKPVVVPPPKGKGKGKEPVWQPPALPSMPTTSSGDASTSATGASQQLRDLVGALKEGPGQVIPGGCHSPAAGTNPGIPRNTTRQLHVAVSPTWTVAQRSTRSGKSQAHHVPILGPPS